MKLAKPSKIEKNVKVSNQIASGRGDFSACMLDVLFYILSDFKSEERFYKVKAKDIMELTKREWNYTQFRDATQELGSRMFEIETSETLLQLWLFSSVKYIKGTGSFEVELSERALPYLTELKEQYTSIQLSSLLMCSSKYAKRLYMLGCQWRGRGAVPMMEINELKIMLGLKDPKGKRKEKYKNWSDFNTKVLEVAKKQINDNTDIYIDYKFEKLGRAYHWIEILINFKAGHQLQIQFDKPIETQKATKYIMDYGFSSKQAVPMAKLGIQEFEKYRKKANDKVVRGEMNMDAVIPYLVKVYQNKGVLVLDNNDE